LNLQPASCRVHTFCCRTLPLFTGEYISVASQKDAEEADIEKERAEQAKGPAAQQRELEELTQIYIGVSDSSTQGS
jgi:VIT1/CCC1 family predicted Fe2+/Mn2+ transporter